LLPAEILELGLSMALLTQGRMRPWSMQNSLKLHLLIRGVQAAEDSGGPAQDDTERESLGVALLASQELSRSMDLKTEVMETLLSYLEVSMPSFIQPLSSI